MKCGKWNEIDLDMFYEILKEYYYGTKFRDKILEVSNLSELAYTHETGSIYLGKTIYPDDYPECNKLVLESLKGMDRERMEKEFKLTYCVVDPSGKNPTIVPLVSEEHLETIIWTWFGGPITKYIKENVAESNQIAPIQLWHYKNPGETTRWVSIDPKSREKYEEENPEAVKMVLLRVIDREFWKKTMDDRLKIGPRNSRENLGEGFPDRKEIIIIPG